MIDKLTHIKVGTGENAKEYPIAFTLNVMEEIQNEYGTLDKWFNALQESEDKEIKMRDIILTFKEFINEGIDIENDEKNENRPFITHKQAGRIVSSIGSGEVAKMVKSMVTNSTSDPNE